MPLGRRSERARRALGQLPVRCALEPAQLGRPGYEGPPGHAGLRALDRVRGAGPAWRGTGAGRDKGWGAPTELGVCQGSFRGLCFERERGECALECITGL